MTSLLIYYSRLCVWIVSNNTLCKNLSLRGSATKAKGSGPISTPS